MANNASVGLLRAAGFEVDDDDVSHMASNMTEHINVHGRYQFNLKQPPKGLRPPSQGRLAVAPPERRP